MPPPPSSLPPLPVVASSAALITAAAPFFASTRSLALTLPLAPTPPDECEGWSIATVYGELVPHSVASLLALALDGCTSAPAHGALFVDLGSGEGVPCLVARTLFTARIARARGVELLPRVHRVAVRLREATRLTVREYAVAEDAAEWALCAADAWKLAEPGAEGGIELLCDDFLDGSAAATSWPEADVVFFNGTCYDVPTLERVWRAAERMRPGSIIIVTTHEMPGRLFELMHEGVVAASWGEASVRVYRRLPLPKWVAGIVGRSGRGGRSSPQPN